MVTAMVYSIPISPLDGEPVAHTKPAELREDT